MLNFTFRGGLAFFTFMAAFLPQAEGQNWTWRGTAPLKQARSSACAVRMADDRVLVTGGTADVALASAEIYLFTPEEKFQDAAPMNAARSGHGCGVLKDGRVLVAGGDAPNLELYEPSIDTWTSIPSTVARSTGTTVTPLDDGRVVITGGKAIEIEVFDPDTSTVAVLPATLTLRDRHSVTLLRDGRLLFAGGMGYPNALNTAEIFNPDTGEVTPAGSLAVARAGHSAIALLDGRVLLAGGTDGTAELNSLEVWIPETNSFQKLSATLKDARQNHAAVLAETNGMVLITGGAAGSGWLNTSELFDPSTDSVQAAGSLTAARAQLAAVVLSDGSILATGGRNDNGPSAACGVLANPSFRFTQTTYHPLERAVVSGTTGVSVLNGRIDFDLVRIDSTGKSASANTRLITPFGTLVSGNLPATPIVDVARADIGSTFVLTLRAVISSTQTVTVQVRFAAKLRPTLQISGLTGAIVAGQPLPTRTTLSGDGQNVDFNGTINITAGASTLAKSVFATAGSFTTDNTLCCPKPGSTISASGVLSLTATYGGNAFLEPSSASNSQLVVSALPGLVLTLGPMRLATPSSLTLTASPVGPALSGSVTIDPSLRPTGTGTVKPANGITSSATLQAFTNTIFGTTATYPSSQAAFTYTPTIADRRAGSVCFDASYSGDSKYQSVAGLSTLACAQVTGAVTILQAVSTPSTYSLGTPTPLTALLTWPNSVGIVSRTVNVSADGRAAGTITLTPDPTGIGSAQGSANILLPFNTRTVALAYPQSGDLLASQTTFVVNMSAVPTSMTARVAPTVSNPFSLGYTISVSNQGVTIPGGLSLAGGIEIRDNGALLQTLPAPAIPTGTSGTFTDGTSNTILPSSILINGSVSNLILPLGQHTLTIRFLGSSQFQASQAQATVTVQ